MREKGSLVEGYHNQIYDPWHFMCQSFLTNTDQSNQLSLTPTRSRVLQ
jgi:hypothetical protein